VLWADARRAIDEVRAFSTADANHYPRFLASFAAIARVLRRVCEMTPPALDDPKAADLMELLKTGRAFRALGKADAYRLLRWMPMAVADLADEWFESEPLRATVASGGIAGSFLGPWSAGTAAILLLLGAGEGHPLATGWFTAGGPGALADALAAATRASGAEIRTSADVARIDVTDETATGVTLASGEQIAARAVVSGTDPKRTLLGLVDPVHLAPDFIRHVQNIRAHGTLAKVNYAVSRLPGFTGLSGRDANQQTSALCGRVRLAADIDAIERAFDAAKYGGFAEEPWIRAGDPFDCGSIAGAGRTACRVGLCAVRALSSQRRPWLGCSAREPWRRRHADDRALRARIRVQRRRSRRDHAARSRAHVWLDRRPYLSRRARARSVLHGAPVARMGALHDTDPPPVSLQRRHPPWHRPERPLRRARRPRDSNAT
jgi:phytoene dehydrogenase-like protein